MAMGRQSRVEEQTQRPRTNSKKDTRRWCRGKEGREHVNERVDMPSWFKVKVTAEVCKVCRKVKSGSQQYNGLPFTEYFAQKYKKES